MSATRHTGSLWAAMHMTWMLLLGAYNLLPSANAAMPFSAEELRSCYRQIGNASTTLTFDDYMTGSPARLHLYSVVEQTSSAPDSVLTIATALNAVRLESLAEQCYSWPGQLVAALYHPVVRQVQDGGMELSLKEREELKALEKKARQTLQEAQQRPGACRLRIIILYDFVDGAFMAALLPINALRNVAILAATTPLVAMIDVDLLISANLGQQLVTGEPQIKKPRRDELLKKCQGMRAAMILPAFQTPKNSSSNAYPAGRDLATSKKLVQDLVQGSKQGVLTATRKGDIIRFASQQFSIGHRRTNFPRWFETSTAYQVEFIKQFEPWYIVDRTQTPLYDVNFRGYGRNKQQQAAHCHAVGMSFWVHPDSFVIHMPHQKSAAQADHDDSWAKHRAGRRPGYLLRARLKGLLNARRLQQLAGQELPQGLQHVRRVDTLFRKFVQQMPAQEYQTMVDPATFACLGELPWWTGNGVRKMCTITKNT